ncbi:hypothetical protein [Actinospica sp.]|jgi:hypothetical protein|uniref:hypothetical protein n=1 Tax=Actinospica sp. TaxID=1872142 RepID=UPI002C83126F|nr:hypothetical protein [Actinospica sp.]HWG24167.1 hypothetical protein [Actinospica sp.]
MRTLPAATRRVSLKIGTASGTLFISNIIRAWLHPGAPMLLVSLADLINQFYADRINPATSYFLPTMILARTTSLESLAIGDYQCRAAMSKWPLTSEVA